ncbi:hypothetical protein [Solibacillus sp. CAU 1738]|uniref:hypothetical protein n=1 Tax=Solibacillus sp. CAU 1738 TaxID=3140363 RepID=UPI0032617FEC
MKVLKIIFAFFCSLSILVLSVLYTGVLFCALLSIIAGFLRTLGIDQIKMTIWNGVELPVAFSIPFSLFISLLLFFCSTYVKRSIVFCVSKLRF